MAVRVFLMAAWLKLVGCGSFYGPSCGMRGVKCWDFPHWKQYCSCSLVRLSYKKISINALVAKLTYGRVSIPCIYTTYSIISIHTISFTKLSPILPIYSTFHNY